MERTMTMIRSGDPRRALLAALRPFAETDTRHLLAADQHTPMTAFVTRSREAVGELTMPAAALVVVIEGTKEVLWGAEQRVYRPGDAIALGAGAQVDVVNVPDEASGVYRALCVTFPRDLVIEAARLWPGLADARTEQGAAVSLDDALCSAIVHAGEALAGQAGASRRVVEHRILEILLVLAERGVLPIAPKYVERSIADAVRLMIRHRLDFGWTPVAVAERLSMSEATLRRRLKGEGETLRGLLLSERMRAAHLILAERDADVAEAIAATGYTSRSHFARHFHEAFGVLPSAVRGSRRVPSGI
jgi:AraC-like DNA-binding protein/quercetin dioxygenase-like cupin family protein